MWFEAVTSKDEHAHDYYHHNRTHHRYDLILFWFEIASEQTIEGVIDGDSNNQGDGYSHSGIVIPVLNV